MLVTEQEKDTKESRGTEGARKSTGVARDSDGEDGVLSAAVHHLLEGLADWRLWPVVAVDDAHEEMLADIAVRRLVEVAP